MALWFDGMKGISVSYGAHEGIIIEGVMLIFNSPGSERLPTTIRLKEYRHPRPALLKV